MASSRDVMVFSLRKAAEALEVADGEVVMPEWDEDVLTHETRGVRIAAQAIAQGCRVHLQDIGYLVRYIADMLEE